jgi:hypothetical protein
VRIECAIAREDWLELIMDGRRFRTGEKYTILERGYAVYLMEQPDELWLSDNGDSMTAGSPDCPSQLCSGHGMLITADPVLVALAIEDWWSRNGVPRQQNVPLPIPTAYEAVDIVRNRRILNGFNKGSAGQVPGLEIMANRGRKPDHLAAKGKRQPGLEAELAKYKAELNHRYWEYQRRRFPNWEEYLERPCAQDGRPPVFRAQHAWRNVLCDPGASEESRGELLRLVPEGEHHVWFRSMNSSQALGLSVLGNLAIHDALGCLSGIQDDEGDSLFGAAGIARTNFSMEHKIRYLGERRRTSLDGYFSGDYRIAIECKYTETAFGTCSRPRLTAADASYEHEHCNGTYSRQRARHERCALSKIGVLYWSYVPALFRFEGDADMDPCPLNRNYQLVRNILAIGVGEGGSVSADNGHVILFYDERNPAFMQYGKGYATYSETRAALRRPEMLRKCSWQRIVQRMRQTKTLPWLTDELAFKYGL